MKRKLLLAIALVFLAVACFGINYFSPQAASAATVTVNKLNAFEYSLSYVLSDAGLQPLTGKTSVTDGRTVNCNGAEVKKDSAAVEAQKQAGFATDGSTIEFLEAAQYTLEVYNTESGALELSFVVDTTGQPTDESISYNLAGIDAYKAKIQESLTVTDGEESDGDDDGQIDKRPIQVNDDFLVPSLKDLIDSEYFDYSSLKATLYYSTPQGTSYSSKDISTGTAKIDVTAVGDYSYYVLFKDTMNNGMSTADLVLTDEGWRNADSNGNPVGAVVIPVFTFRVDVAAKPEVAVGVSEKAYINMVYSVECFTITASNYSTVYTLYYSENLIEQGTLTNAEYCEKITTEATEVTLDNGFEEANLFNSSAKSFKPLKKGYYYVQLLVVDGANMETAVVSKPIAAQSEYKKVVLETQFWYYNWQSMVFLGIAVLCFVAIIVILCIKPKEATKTLTVNKK